MNTQQAPIDHWSYSSLSLYLRNQLAFKKKYVLKIYDDLTSPAAVVGSAGHEALKVYLQGGSVAASVEAGIRKIDTTSDNAVNWGRTGSREKIMKDYTRAINQYFAEEPGWHKRSILKVEEPITTRIAFHDGKEAVIPLKVILDVLWHDQDEALVATDHKFVKGYTLPEEENPAYILQAMFAYYGVFATTGVGLDRMYFDEIKISKNKNNEPQIQQYVIEFANHPEYFTLFENIYNDCTKSICRDDAVYLPNFQDIYDGENVFLAYRDNLITSAPPVVSHKIKQEKFVEQRYQESAPDVVANDHLPQEEIIRLKLQEFGLPVQMEATYVGASVILYTLKPSRGLSMARFEKVAPDLALALGAYSIRVQAPIYGTKSVGIEVPNPERHMIELFDENGQINEIANMQSGTLNLPIGVDVYGNTLTKSLADMPHLLVAGATGSGKSVFINTALHALTSQNTPAELQLLLIDPKRVELAPFKHLPHLLENTPPIYEYAEALTALTWLANDEMEARYAELEQRGVRSIDEITGMPRIVVVIDEFADLVLVNKASTRSKKGKLSVLTAGKREYAKREAKKASEHDTPFTPDTTDLEVEPTIEELIVRLAQKARAVGIHLIIGTQRPSVDVVTGLIKANMPTRIAFRTASATDSKVILDQQGAEELIGKGDMLYLDPSERGLKRLQAFKS